MAYTESYAVHYKLTLKFTRSWAAYLGTSYMLPVFSLPPVTLWLLGGVVIGAWDPDCRA